VSQETNIKYNSDQDQICGRQSNSQKVSLGIFWFFPVNTIPPVLGTHLRLNINLIRRTSGWNLGTFKQNNVCIGDHRTENNFSTLPCFRGL